MGRIASPSIREARPLRGTLVTTTSTAQCVIGRLGSSHRHDTYNYLLYGNRRLFTKPCDDRPLFLPFHFIDVRYFYLRLHYKTVRRNRMHVPSKKAPQEINLIKRVSQAGK